MSLAKLAARAAETLTPFAAHLTLTHACQLACAHCYQSEHHSEDLSTDEVFRLLAELKQLGTFAVTLSGGDPLLRKDFWEIAAETARLRFHWVVYTNGLKVDAEVAQRLRALGVARVEVSLHGAHAFTHDSFVGRKGAMQKVLDAVEHLLAAGVHTVVKTSVHRGNASELPELKARFTGRPGLEWQHDTTMHQRDDGDRSPNRMEATDRQLLAIARWEAAALQPRPRADASRPLPVFDPAKAAPCNAGRSSLAIEPTGDVLACVMLPNMILGNVRERPLSAIWLDNPAVAELRALTLASYEHCRGCEFISVCSHCPASSLNESGSLTGHSESVCRKTKTFWTTMRERYAELGLPPPI